MQLLPYYLFKDSIDSSLILILFSLIERLLVALTSPIECLVFEEPSNQLEKTPYILHELNQLLYNAKESFLDPRTTRALIDHVSRILENVNITSASAFCLFALYFSILETSINRE
jgi:hypothetical protein